MPRYFQNHEIDYQQWDACIEASLQRMVYALSWYLDIVAPGWAALIEAQNGQYLAVMPLPEARKFNITYVYQPFFCQQLGLFSRQEVALDKFIQVLVNQYTYISSYSLNTGNISNLTPENIAHLQVSHYHTHHLNLTPGYKQLYQKYTRDRKLNLKRAEKAGLEIITSTDIHPLINLFKADAAARIKGGVSEATYHLLERLYFKLKEKNLATLLYTQTPAGEINAGCLFVHDAGKIIYLFNAASRAARNLNGRTLIIDKIIRQYASQPYIFDFESPADVSSITRVYKGFGAEPVPYLVTNYNNLPQPIKFIKYARQYFYQKIWPGGMA